jgi:hypothetical protein
VPFWSVHVRVDVDESRSAAYTEVAQPQIPDGQLGTLERQRRTALLLSRTFG